MSNTNLKQQNLILSQAVNGYLFVFFSLSTSRSNLWDIPKSILQSIKINSLKRDRFPERQLTQPESHERFVQLNEKFSLYPHTHLALEYRSSSRDTCRLVLNRCSWCGWLPRNPICRPWSQAVWARTTALWESFSVDVYALVCRWRQWQSHCVRGLPIGATFVG